jgi:transcriptional regulator with XRE-family HTH domain
MSDHQEHKKLGELLRYHRSRLTPEQLGLPTTTRRRTPGLRREEIAGLVGISTTWYTALEQGRDIQVSRKVLEKLAHLFELSYQERVHFFSLANNLPVLSPHSSDEQPSPLLQRMLDYHAPGPAYLLGMRWDIVGWNAAACAAFPMMAHFDEPPRSEFDRNLVYLMFTNQQARRVIVSWEEHAQRILKHFRVDYAQHKEAADFEGLIQALMHQSPEFAEWWSCPDIGVGTMTRKEVAHPMVGQLLLEQSTYLVVDSPTLKMVLDVPQDRETYHKLQYLHTERGNAYKGMYHAKRISESG